MPTMSQLPFIAHGKTSIWSHSAAHLATRGGDLGWRRNILRAKEVRERRKEMEFNELAFCLCFALFCLWGKKNIIMQPTTTTNGYFQNRHSFVMNNRLAWLSQFTFSFSSREIFPEIFICKFFTLVFPSPHSAARIDVIDKFFLLFHFTYIALSFSLSSDISL